MPYKSTIKEFAVFIMSLKKRVKGKHEEAIGVTKYFGEKNTAFTAPYEIRLVKYILTFQLALKNNITHPLQREKLVGIGLGKFISGILWCSRIGSNCLTTYF